MTAMKTTGTIAGRACVVVRLLALAALAAAGACGAAEPASQPGPGQPLATVTSDGGHWVVSIQSSPQPPRKGTVDVTYTITSADAQGAPADGLTLNVVPWMPAHGHGGSELPVVTPLGGGAYLATPVYLYMSGHWELRTEIDGDVTDNAAPAFDVP
jgi:hypothetical protein